jgi:integrase/recombinase XerD
LRTGTLRVYRQVLRHFRTFLCARVPGTRPGHATPAQAREFLHRLSDRHVSWSWTATHITALRTVFDKLGGTALTEGMVTPKRPRRLHDILEPEEVGRLLQAAGSTRDRLAILLLYGCGLKTSELCSLRWSEVDIAGRTVQISFAGGTRQRKVLLPANSIAWLQAECCYRQGTDPVFAGRPRRKPAKSDLPAGSPVSTRTVERIVRHAAVAAGLTTKEVNCRTLRRSYAVQCLRDGMDVEKLRDSLGHLHVASTLTYCRYLAPKMGEAKDVWVTRQVPLPCVAFSPAVGTIQCSAP